MEIIEKEKEAMKYLIISISILLYHANVLAEHPEHYLGKFAGKEKFDVQCSNSSWNSSGNRDWNADHNEVNGNTYKAVVITGGGKYFAEGTISGVSAKGKFKGKDSFGNDCNGEFSNTLNGDNFKSNSKGNCPAVSCNFIGEVTATRK